MLRRLGIRAKVLAVLAVPVLVLLAISSFVTAQSVNEARTAATVRDVVAVLPLSGRAAESLQQERTLSVQEADDKPLGGNLEASRAATDTAIAALTDAVRALDLSALDSRVREAVVTADTQHGRLAEIRARVDADTIPASLVSSNYTDIVDSDNNVTGVVAETLSERSLASQMSAYAAIAETIEQVLRAGPVADDVLADDGADSGAVRELAALLAVGDNARSEARELTNNLRIGNIQLPSRDADLTAMQLSLTSGNELTVSALDATRWNGLVNAELAALRPVAADLLESAASDADALATQAQEQTLLTVGLTVAAAVLSIVIAFIVSRGIVVPMRRLTAAAGNVREELPRLVEQVAVPGESPDLTLADIPVESQDEVGRLAQAFNDVNATTIQVAREQAALRGSIAEMFVNVARRDQVLLGRQLSFIDSLERSEEDPAVLANLFRLDHLATRMRRNAESLLVLAGIDSGRRLREAMPLSDVVRTASSEIEQYDRVQLDLRADPLMHGFNALAAAHLLAELLENATLFSEPGTPVVVETGVDGDHVVVRIVDQGLGMSPAEIEAANRTIASTSPTEALGAQRLGLFVVARLAQRLGARVSLVRATGDVSGTAAVVRFPVALFTSNDPALTGGPGAAQRTSGPATGSVPVADAPVAVPVDLAALTDGATTTGLPRRRTADAPTGRSELPTEQDVVLPAPTETTLSPEIAAEASGWTPAVAPSATGPAALPSRGSLPSRAPAVPPVDDTPVTPAAPAGPRSGLFSAFRARELAAGDPAGQDGPPAPATGSAVPEVAAPEASAPQTAAPEVTAPEAAAPEVAAPWEHAPLEDAPREPVAPAASVFDTAVFDTASFEAAMADHEPELSPEDHARLDALSAPLTGDLPVVTRQPVADAAAELEAFRTAPEPASEPEPEPAPVQPAAFVVPGLVPDETPDAGDAWDGGWAASEPAATTDTEPAAAPGWEQPAASWDSPATAWSQDAPAPSYDAPAPTWQDDAPAPSWSQEAPAAPAPWSETPAWSAPVPTESSPAPLVARHAEPQHAEPQHAEPQAVEQHGPYAQQPAPQPFAEQPAPQPVAAAPAPVATAPAAPAAPALPDFASLVQGDEPAEPARRQRERRSFFSFRRKQAEPAAPVAATPAPSAAPAWPATSSPAGVPVTPPAPAVARQPVLQQPVVQQPAPQPVAPQPVAPQPVAPAVAPVLSQTWLPAAAAAVEAEQPAAAAPVWTPQAPAEWAPAPAAEAPSWGAPQAFAPEQGAPAQPVATPPAPVAPAEPTWAAAAPAAAPLPTRTRGAVPPPVPEPTAAPIAERRAPRDISAWASSWSPEGGSVPQPAPAPTWSSRPAAAPAAASSPAPTGDSPRRPGGMDAEAAAMLSLRADIQEQALSELTQLSAYRPQVDVPAGGSLTRRVPTAIPAAPEISTPDSGPAPARDADGLRSRLSSFQSGSRRGRRSLTDAGEGQPGTMPDQQPRTESDQQPVPPSPSW
jgi:signal transduction histidine kinase